MLGSAPSASNGRTLVGLCWALPFLTIYNVCNNHCTGVSCCGEAGGKVRGQIKTAHSQGRQNIHVLITLRSSHDYFGDVAHPLVARRRSDLQIRSSLSTKRQVAMGLWVCRTAHEGGAISRSLTLHPDAPTLRLPLDVFTAEPFTLAWQLALEWLPVQEILPLLCVRCGGLSWALKDSGLWSRLYAAAGWSPPHDCPFIRDLALRSSAARRVRWAWASLLGFLPPGAAWDLNPGASEGDLQAFERAAGLELPRELRASLAVHNGGRTRAPFLPELLTVQEMRNELRSPTGPWRYRRYGRALGTLIPVTRSAVGGGSGRVCVDSGSGRVVQLFGLGGPVGGVALLHLAFADFLRVR